jgi:hypothetical protein
MRTVARAIILLLALAALSIGVAWTCAAYASLDLSTVEVLARVGHAPTGSKLHGFGRTRIDWEGSPEPVPAPTTDAWDRRAAAFDPSSWAHSVEDAGWPFRCMRATVHGAALILSTDERGINGVGSLGAPGPQSPLVSGIRLADERLTGVLAAYSTWRALPLQPLWLGLVGNIVAYLASLALLGLMARAARQILRAHRARHGRCTHCAHPLMGLATCPECGATNNPTTSKT